jgi:Ni/Co efflux regulator RcnB
MKRIMLAATAVMTLATSVAAPAAMAQPRGYERSYNDHRDRHDDRRVVVHKETRIYRDRPNHWRAGDRFGSYRDYREVSYRDYRLKQPPRGYHYVRDNNTGEIILAAIATGLIASIILN